MTLSREVIRRAIRKASRSISKYKVSALGFSYKGDLICQSMNRPRFSREGGGIHAEMELMFRGGPGLKTILLCRTNNAGEILRLDPCEACASKATELGIKIVSLKEGR